MTAAGATGVINGGGGDRPRRGPEGRAALEQWRRTLVTAIGDDGPDLTARQMAILLTLYLTPPPHSVRGLSESLGVPKPAVTRAFQTIEKLGFATRRRVEDDRRNMVVGRTMKGAMYLNRFANYIHAAAGPEGHDAV